MPLKLWGHGTIRIKIHDGTIRTLMNVKHVPNLKKKLISLGALEENSCKIIMEDGVLKLYLVCWLRLREFVTKIFILL